MGGTITEKFNTIPKEEFNRLKSDNCKLHIDYDIIAFNASAAMETRSVIVKHNSSGRTMPFKNRTEFYGRGKTIGGWLYETNTKRAEAGAPIFSKEDFTIEDVYNHNPEESHVYQSAKTKVNGLCNYLGVYDYCGGVGIGRTFRHDLLLPKEYKSERDPHKPFWLPSVKDYLVSKHNGYEVRDVETDDKIVQAQFKGWRNFKSTGEITDVALSIDKDSLSTPGFLFNFNKDQSTGRYKHPEIIVIDDGIGRLWIEEKGKTKQVKGWGSYWLAYQLLLGDSTDTIEPYKPFGIKYGEMSFYKEVSDIRSQAELFSFVRDKYRTWFINGVSFKAWNGEQVEISSDQWLEIIFKLIYMHRVDNDPTTFSKMLQHYQSKA